MRKLALFTYAVGAYAAFNLCFLYHAGFLLEVGVPKSINSGAAVDPALAVAIDLGLIALFGAAHSLMARDRFKRVWTRIVPPAAERSTYVWQSSLLLGLIMWQWQPLPVTIWQIDGPAALAIVGIFIASLGLIQLATFQIDHFELVGLKQAWHGAAGTAMTEPGFKTPFLYRIVRHPMQLGVVIMYFATPHMTAGHLLMATAMTGYVFAGLYFEERALLARFGQAYADYRSRVPMLIPRFWPKGGNRLAQSGQNA